MRLHFSLWRDSQFFQINAHSGGFSHSGGIFHFLANCLIAGDLVTHRKIPPLSTNPPLWAYLDWGLLRSTSKKGSKSINFHYRLLQVINFVTNLQPLRFKKSFFIFQEKIRRLPPKKRFLLRWANDNLWTTVLNRNK